MRVNEIFYSLQGEGHHAGRPAIFIRLAGCNLSCGFCDTEFESGAEMSNAEILNVVSRHPGKFIVWTGGEPSTQLDQATVDEFKHFGYEQAIEANGSHPVPKGLDWITVSPKVAEHVVARHFPDGVNELRYAWHAGKTSVPLPSVCAEFYYLSPIFSGENGDKENIKHCIALCLGNPLWRLSTQQHKIIGLL